jgi:hypothetical protein
MEALFLFLEKQGVEEGAGLDDSPLLSIKILINIFIKEVKNT